MAELAGTGRKTKRFRVACEGQTIDGRALERQDLQDMADTYDPDHYGARINVEHIRGFSPEAPFNAYGDILLVEAIEEAGRLCLYNTVSALPNMLSILDKGQKIYPSVEFIPNFAGTGKSYQVGLGLTDIPASLNTESLKFNAHGNVNRTVPDQEIFIMSQPQSQHQSFASKISTLLSGFVATTAPAATAAPTATPAPAATPTAEQQFQAATFEGFSKLMTQQGQMAQAIHLLSTKLDGMQPATTPTTQPVTTPVAQPATVPPVQQHATQLPNAPTAQPPAAPAPAVTEPVTLEQLMANIATIAQGQQNMAATLQQLGATPQAGNPPTATGSAGMRNEF